MTETLRRQLMNPFFAVRRLQAKIEKSPEQFLKALRDTAEAYMIVETWQESSKSKPDPNEQVLVSDGAGKIRLGFFASKRSAGYKYWRYLPSGPVKR